MVGVYSIGSLFIFEIISLAWSNIYSIFEEDESTAFIGKDLNSLMRCNNNSFKNFIAVKLLTSITEIVFDCTGGGGGGYIFPFPFSISVAIDGGFGKLF